MIKTYSVWLDKLENSFTVVEGIKQPDFELNSVLVKTFEAESWNDAMAQYHAWQGWEPYKPMD